MNAYRYSPVRIAIAMSIVGLGVLPDRNAAQAPAGCLGNCTIELQRVATLSDAGHPDTLPHMAISVLAASSTGYVTRARDGRRLAVFDRNGRLVRFITGSSDRPFQLIANFLAGPSGTLRVYDLFSRSLTTVGRDFTILEVIPFPYPPTLVLPGNEYILVQQIATPELVGQPFHVLRHDGRIVRSFGSTTGAYRADAPLLHDRVATIGADGMLWGTPLGAYVLEKWNPATGMRVSGVSVQSEWFKPSARFEAPGGRPVPIIDALWEQGGHLWVLLRDADSRWRAPERAPGERVVDWREFENTYDSILEVIAIRTGEVIASRRFPSPLQGRSSTFLLSSYEQQTNGVRRIVVSRPRLARKETTR